MQKAHDELKQRVEERTAELAIFKKFAEASGLGFGMTSLDGRIAYVNSAWLRLVGESQVEDVIGQHISTYCPKEYLERRDTEVLPAVLDKGLWQGEFGRGGRSRGHFKKLRRALCGRRLRRKMKANDVWLEGRNTGQEKF